MELMQPDMNLIIIEMNNPYLSYIFKIRIGSDRKEHDIIVSKSNDPELIYNYAVKIKEADVLLLEDALINLRGKIIEETYIKYLILYLNLYYHISLYY